ncbi:acetyl-CoA synthetase [Haloplanus salinus]|uniref:Acetyl-CoA synthetase n=1 Tax=Haloplanus salinus TaxID=1126245 RepID=A0A368NFW2_9EURY|nr:AMP-binding protein [Haloplanus salinus]RCU48311.1 acetyl-CoA synthetase [Haloplanus salinus]
MHVLCDVVARDRRSDEVALRVDATGREFSYRDFCTTAWKAGHALSHCGVHPGARVALAPEPAPQPLLTLFGAACLGARVTFDTAAESRAVLVPADREGDVAARPDRKVVAYGDAPDDPGVVHWERTVWSENPVQPPGERDPEEAVLDGAERRSADTDTGAGSRPRADAATYTHREVLRAAASVVDAAGIDAATSVALRASLTEPRTVVAGVVAPLSVGGTVVLPAGEPGANADVVVGGDDADVRLADVPL